MRLGPPVQLGYAVADVVEAAGRWAATTSAGPFFLIEHIPLAEVRYRGAPAAFDHSSAYGQWGDVMVELVQDHTAGPSPIRDLMGPRGEGLHHVAHFVDDLERGSAALAAMGWPEVLRASTAAGQAFAFHDARADRGHLVELYEPSDRLLGFYAMVAEAAAAWDGRDPVRRPLR